MRSKRQGASIDMEGQAAGGHVAEGAWWKESSRGRQSEIRGRGLASQSPSLLPRPQQSGETSIRCLSIS